MRREVDDTPSPTTVEADIVPRARDSAGSFAVAMAQKEKSGQVEQITQARRSRKLLRALMVPTVAMVGVVGPNAFYSINDHGQDDVRAAVAKVEGEPAPSALKYAQAEAAHKLFGLKGRGINVEAAQIEANKPGKGELLDAHDYIDSELVQIDEEGKFFTVEGKDYELAKRRTEEGNVYIVAGRHFTEEGLIRDRERLVSLVLVGGARNDTNSDLNKDGIVTPEEVNESADRSARHNLKNAFQPPKRLIVSQENQNQNK